jgi:hypothetical protein
LLKSCRGEPTETGELPARHAPVATKETVMTLLAVKPTIPQPDIGAVLDALAHRMPVEIDCGASPTQPDVLEVTSRSALQEELESRFPFRSRMAPITEKRQIGVTIALDDGPPIEGRGENLAIAMRDFLSSALDYIARWERELRFGAEHQKYWGWVYRLLLAGDDEHILATLLNRPIG